MRQSKWKWILVVPLTLFGMCIVGYLLLVLVYSISTERMQEEMRESVRIFVTETGAYTPAGKQLDNFTDSLMLLTASHPNGENPWKDAIRVPQFRSNDMEPTQLLIDMFSGQETEKQEVSYGRYWHGYLIFLKPLLAVFSYSQIRDILSMVQIGLFMVIVLLLAKKEKYYHSIGMFLFWMVMNPIAGMLSLQYSSLLILTFIAVFGILVMDSVWEEHMERWMLFFLVIGGLTSYLDLLTFPVVTLGIPLILWLSLDKSGQRGKIRNLLGCSFFWALGYGGLWAEKWLLGTWITKESVWKDALGAVQYRMASSNNGIPFTWQTVLEKQMEYFRNPPVDLFILFTITVLAALILAKKIRLKLNGQMAAAYGMIAVYPFLWYGLVKNHSFVHFWFTYRNLSVTFFAVCMFVIGCIENGNRK